MFSLILFGVKVTMYQNASIDNLTFNFLVFVEFATSNDEQNEKPDLVEVSMECVFKSRIIRQFWLFSFVHINQTLVNSKAVLIVRIFKES